MKFSVASWTPRTWLIIFITICAAVVRLWNFSGTFMFQGDQGRDALIVSQIFTQADLVFIGPVTSVGNMYLGPLYYYFMLPFLWLTYPSPLGPGYAVALLGILTVPLMYFLGRKLIGERAALVGAFLTAFSSVIVTYSRFSWNPNPAPLVGLGMVFATYMAWQKNKWYWLVVAACFSILIQLHYLGLLMLGGAGVIWLWQTYQLLRSKKNKTTVKALKQQALVTVLGVALFILSLTPLILFDYKHDGLNAKAFVTLFTQEEIVAQESSWQKITDIVKGTHGRSIHMFFEHTFGQDVRLNTFMLVVLVLILIKVLKNPSPHRFGYLTVLAYVITTVIGTAVYQHSIFNHYILFILPAVFWTVGIALSWLSRSVPGTILTVLWLGVFLVLNIRAMPLITTTSTIYDMQVVTDSISSKLQPGEPYSLVLLSPSRDLYGQNYRYFLSTGPTPALPPERAGEAQTLVVIDEEQNLPVYDLPIYEIVTFPEKKPSEVYTIPDGPRIWIFRKSAP